MWKLLLNWEELATLGTDLVAYAAIAMVGTLFFLIRLLMATIGFDGDADGDMGGDADGSGSDASFSLFSLLSILAFFMGAGWMGLAARLDWEIGQVGSFFLSIGFGTVMMLSASAMMYGLRKLHHESKYDLESAVGKTGRTYLKIPASGEGQGQVEVAVSGRRKILAAVSNNKKIASFQAVRIVEVRDDSTLVVEPLDQQGA